MRIRKPIRARLVEESGMSLLEVMVGMIMLSLGLLMLLPMVTVAMDANVNANRTREAHVMIQNQMEKLRVADQVYSGFEYDTLSGMSTTWWSEPQTVNMDKVIVECYWYDQLGTWHTQRGVTYCYKKPPSEESL